MIGRVIKGKYKIYDEVGAGGFATVYLGRNMDTNEIVAIKVLGEQFTREPRYVERFRREAGLAERLRHPNIVRVFDHGIESGMNFLVMEFVEGLTLDKIIARKGGLPVDEVLSYVEQTCAGLQAAYQAGVVHRDIKPANLMITPKGTVKIMDFGIARMESMSGLTQSGVFMGTPRYISPEMATGAGADIRSDLYALGLLTYEMLAGKAPFDADNPWAVLRQQIEVEPAPLHEIRPDVPPWLEAIIMRAVAKDPDKRFQTPAGMLAAVKTRTAVSGGGAAAPVAGPPTVPPAGATSVGRTRPTGLLIGLAVAAIVVAAALAALLVFGMGGDKATPTAVVGQLTGESQTRQPTGAVTVLVVTNTPAQSSRPTATESGPTDTVLPEPTATENLEPTNTPRPTDAPTRVPTETSRPTATPTLTDTPKPAASPTTAATAAPQPTNTPTSAPAPAISGKITFSAGGLLHVVNAATGQDLFAPIPDMRQPDMRADGELVIVKGYQGARTSLWTINANTGAFVREQSPFTNDYHPFWAPDASRYTYDSLHHNERDLIIFVAPLDNRDPEAHDFLYYGTQPIIGTSPVWMHDDWIAFTACDYWPEGGGGATCGIYRVPSWNEEKPLLVRSGGLTMRATDNHGGDLLFMSLESGNWEVYVSPNTGGTGRNLSNSSSSNDGLATFSPDGKWVAFVSNRGGTWAVWVVKLDGTGLSRLFDLPAPPTGEWTEEHMSWGP
jgi:serine/threonine-protein kinase